MFQFFHLKTCVLQQMFSTVAKYRQVCAQSGRHNCELSIHHDCTCCIADVYFTHPGMNDSQQTHLSDNQFASSVLNVHLRGVIIHNATDECVYGCVETISQGFFILPVQDKNSQKWERPIKTIKPLLGFRKCNQSRTKNTVSQLERTPQGINTVAKWGISKLYGLYAKMIQDIQLRH